MPSITNQETIDLIVQYYCTNGFVKSVALMDAGYDEGYAKTCGLKIYENIRVKAAIAKKMAVLAEKVDVETDEVVKELRKLSGLDEGAKNLNNADKIRSLELLGKYKGMFKDVSLNLNADIPTDPVEYKSWLRKELDRLEDSNEVIDSYAKSRPAIAQRY